MPPQHMLFVWRRVGIFTVIEARAETGMSLAYLALTRVELARLHEIVTAALEEKRHDP